MYKKHRLEERAAESNPALLHPGITLSDWFPESHTTFIQWVSLQLLHTRAYVVRPVSPLHHKTVDQTDPWGAQCLFQSKLVAK